MFKTFLSKSLASLLPQQCILCASSTHTEKGLCQACIADLPLIKRPCQHCGMPLTKTNLICGKCITNPPPYSQLIAPFLYKNPLDHIVSALKFHNKLTYTELLGTLVAAELPKRIQHMPEIIIPVPLHKGRLKERGYNQALEIAKPISRLLQIPIDYRSCMRHKLTQAQTGLTIGERKLNIKNAFQIQRDFSAKSVAIFDDVVTTGSTANELCNVLKSYGVKHIQIWCCARTILK